MTITLTREEAQSVLDALEEIYWPKEHQAHKEIETLRARLSAPEDIYEEGCTPTDFRVLREANARMAQELFELKREWQGLTENEKELLWDEAVEGQEHFCSQYGNFADALEAKLKEKNT
jgi:hypothetical protein